MNAKLNTMDFKEVAELIKISDVDKPIEGLTLNFVNRYWITKGDCLIKLKNAAYQCSEIKEILEVRISNAPDFYKGCEIVIIPTIFFQRHN